MHVYLVTRNRGRGEQTVAEFETFEAALLRFAHIAARYQVGDGRNAGTCRLHLVKQGLDPADYNTLCVFSNSGI